MIELCLAITVIVVALVANSASNARLSLLRRANHDRALAQNAVRAMCEEIQSMSRGNQEDPLTWSSRVNAALSNGGSIGATFDVQGLTPAPGDARVGTIRVVTNEGLTDAVLGVDVGLPRDLNGDGDTSDADVSVGARILPVVVSVRWRGTQATQQIRHPIYIASY
jgi:hypothetical protein